jgi:GNAT superfamily N-acetyltransferase
MKIQFRRESIAVLRAEGMALLERLVLEVGQRDMFPFDPDWRRFERMEADGAVYVLTVRADEQLIGYAVFLLQMHLHYKHTRVAINDAIGLDPDHRRGRVGVRLIRYAELALEALGVKKIYYHYKPGHKLGNLLDQLDYPEFETVRARRLG